MLPDWSLPTKFFRRMVRRWTLPDLFAMSALILHFFPLGDAPEAEALDALAQPWNFRLAYTFPPPLLLCVIRKIAVSSGVFLLVTPFWPAQKWFPAVLGLMDRSHVGPSASLISSTRLEDFRRLRGLADTRLDSTLISRLLCGVFQNRPPARRFASWDLAVVFTVISSFPMPLNFVARSL